MAPPLIILADMDSQTAAAWFAAWGTWIAAVASTVVAALAIFGDWIRGKFFKPKCILECGISDAFWHALENANGTTFRQIRLRLLNIGNAPAHEIEVHLLGAFKVSGKDRVALTGFVPVRLMWTHGGPAAKSYLAPATCAFVDFGTLSPVPGHHHLSAPAQLSLNVEVANTNLWMYGGGTYQFELGVVTPAGYLRRSVFEVSFDNQWKRFTDMQEVLDGNFSIKQIYEIACES
ncbi:hypothetical protein [Prosthecobacter sp.]|jgi:hypothetical protein|uniref:hypothetical protein n=1 Tax=Prosthecobacter sp. TaxID=1965333 RepID=UPI0037C91957